MVPKIAISQAPYQRDTPYCLGRALEHMRQARRLGADLIVFPEWFLGLNPLEVLPNRQTETLCRHARDLALGVVTGTLRTLDAASGQRQQQALVIDLDGRVLGTQAKCEFYPAERPWFDGGDGIHAIATRFGRAVVLLGLDAQSPARWAECHDLYPDLVFLITSARTQRDAEALQELAQSESIELGATVVLVPLTGRFAGSAYVGGALAAHRGRILAAVNETETVVVASAATAALIQLGAVDAAAAPPALDTRGTDRAAPPGRPPGPEPERRVFVDWTSLTATDPLAAGRQLLAAAYDSPRQTALSPAHPQYPEVLEALLAEGGRGGLAWPALLSTHAYDARYLDLGGLLARLGRPLLAACGDGTTPLRFSAPGDFDDLARAFPDLTLILRITGRHPPFWEEALTLARLRPNIHLLTAGMTLERLEQALAAAGPDRLLFGTGGAPGQFAPEWERLETLRQRANLDDEAFQRIAALNARRLFFHDWEPRTLLRPEAERPR